ncbi:MAG: transcriptional repressor [Campylobacterota bacterium]|nr:transcriptional repressor [Campylobacterota bacterium]
MQTTTELLKSYELKVTPQRMAIVEELASFGHLGIDELYQKLTKRFPTISLATIYKNTNAMVEKLFVQEVKLPNQKSKYELVKAEHAHVICGVCGRVEDITLDTESMVDEVSRISHYKIERDDLVFSGICPACMEKESA